MWPITILTLQKAFFNEQCKEIEGNNRKFRSRDLFKKTGNMKLPFCSKLDKIKDRNGKDLIEAGEIKRWKDYTEEPYQEDLIDSDNHDGTDSHSARHCGVWSQWALGSTAANKASGGDGIPAELFKILKDGAIKYVRKFGKPSSGHRTGKGQSSSQFPRRAVLKNVQTTGQLHSFLRLVRLCPKSSKLGWSTMWTKNFWCSSWV